MYMSISEIVNKIRNGESLYLYNSKNKDIIYFSKNSFIVKNDKEEYSVFDIENYLKRLFVHGVKATFSKELYNSYEDK